MKFIDLFAGIGGFRLGMEMAGHECVGHCEIDKFANASYIAMHNPKESEWFATDITRIRAADIPRADCWCFGFPCQDISVAGKQGGFTRGKRSSLFFTVTGLIRNLEEEDRPSYLFIENVKNLLSINRGFDFAKILIELDEIGYNAEWQVLNSKHFGVPQNRERVFIIGHLRGRGGREVFPISAANGETDIPIKIIAHRKGYRRNTQTFAPDGVTEALSTCQGGGRGHHVFLGYNTMPDGTARTIKSQYSKNGAQNFNRSDGYGATAAMCVPVLTPESVNIRQNGRRFKENGEPMFTLTSQDRHGVMIYNAVEENNAHCLDANYHKGVLSQQKRTGIYDSVRIRRLTPRECFRLQGFSDKYFDRAAAVNSDTQLYKQAGNSVTVNVIYEIAKRLGKE